VTTYYVSTTGNDSNPGTEVEPWETVDKAFSTAAAGDIVIFEDGTYTSNNESPANDGSSGNPITFKARNSRQVTFKVTRSSAAAAVGLTNDYITFDGIVFDGNRRNGGTNSRVVGLLGANDHITFNDCKVYDAGHSGIRFISPYSGVTNLTIENCDIELHLEFVTDPTGDGIGNGIMIYGPNNSDILIKNCEIWHTSHNPIYSIGCDGLTIENCTLHDTNSHGIGISGDDHTNDNIIIRDNVIYNAGMWGSLGNQHASSIRVMYENTKSVQIYRNVIYDGHGPGLIMDDSVVGPVKFVNNTVYNCNQKDYGQEYASANIAMFSDYTPNNHPSITFKNNIIYYTRDVGRPLSSKDGVDTNLDADYNLYYATGTAEEIKRGTTVYDTLADYETSGEEPNSVFEEDPLFVDLGAKDFTLQGGSPAVDAGVDVGLAYSGSAPDIGALEIGNVVLPAGVTSAESFGSATLTGAPAVGPTGIVSAEAFGSPTITGGTPAGGAVAVGVVRQAANTATGNQDFTVSGLGAADDIKGALFIITRAISDGTAADHANVGIGAATGASNQWCISSTDEHGVTTSDSGERTNSDMCIQILNPGAVSVDGEASFVSTVTDGVRVNWTDAPGSAYFVTALIVAGTDVSAHANWKDLGDTKDAAVDVTDPGFQPKQLITACRDVLDDSGSGSNVRLSIGAVNFGGSVTQRCYCQRSLDGKGTTEVLNRFTESYGAMAVIDNGSLDWGAEFSDPDSDGFTVTPRNAGANNTALFYLALSFGGSVETNLVTVNSPTSTGNDAQTGPGHQPQAVIMGLTHAEAVDTTYDDGRGGVHGLSTFTESDEYSSALAMEDGQVTSDTQSLSDDTAINLPQDDGSAGHAASFVSFDASGWTLNFTTTMGTAKKWWALTIGALTQVVTPSGVVSAEAFGTAQVNLTLRPDGAESEETFGLTKLRLFLQPSGISSEETHGSTKVTYIVTFTGISSEEAFGSSSLLRYVVVTGLASAEAFGTALLTVYAIPGGIETEEAFGSTTLELFLIPTSVASVETFGAATVSPGVVTVTPSGAASLEVFGSHAMSLGAAFVEPSGIVSTEAFGVAETAMGLVIVEPAGVESEETFGATICFREDILYPTGVTSLEAFGTATMGLGAVSVEPTGIVSVEAFGTSALELFVTTTSVTSFEAFGIATVAPGTITVVPDGVASLEAFGTAALSLSIAPGGLVSAETFGTAILGLFLTPDGIASLETFGSHTLGVVLVVTGVGSAETFGAHVLAPGAVAIQPDGATSLEAFGAPHLSKAVTPMGISSDESFGTANLFMWLAIIAAVSIESGEAFGSTCLLYPDFIVYTSAPPRGFSATAGERPKTMKPPSRGV
jgi:hypothetical protein